MSDEDDSGDDQTQRGDPFDELEEEVEDREGDPFNYLEAEEEEEERAETGDDTPTAEPTPETSEEDTPDASPDPATAFEQEADDSVEPAGLAEAPDSGPGIPGERGPDSVEPATGDEEGDPTDSSQMAFGVGRDKTTGDEEKPFMQGIQREGDPFENVGGAFEEMEVGGLDPDRVWQDLESAESRGSIGEATERTYADVSKHSYCEQCEYFSNPGDIVCTHEGTEIVEFLDMEHVRVVDCPIVAEREALEEAESVASSEQESSVR